MTMIYVDELRIRDATGRPVYAVDLVADAGRERVVASYSLEEAHAAATAWRRALERAQPGRFGGISVGIAFET
jgi:hypothetical protein